MNNLEENIQKYANLVVKSGINVQKNQIIVITCPISAASFARLVMKKAYEAGAIDVIMIWEDEKAQRIRYDNSPLSVFEITPEWFSDRLNSYAKKGAGFISILANDPDIFKGIDQKKPAAAQKSNYLACKEWYDSLDKNINSWNIVGVPSPEWAKKVFPNLSESDAVSELWNAILKAVRVDTPNPVLAWEEHKKSFAKKIEILNNHQFDKLHYKNSAGTDITIGLTKNHIWAGGGAALQNGIYYFPNMPTEEIFCSPDRNLANGIVFSSMPLNHHGSIVDDFSITFKEGKVVDFSAKVGYDVLKEIIGIDEGSHHLGEIALIPIESPISEMGILFYNTLFDENASCHFALGKGFSECIKDGVSMTDDELLQKGINDSATHVDFMLGTNDMSITGIKSDKTQIQIFENGNFVI